MENRFKLKLSNMFRSSFGSCRTRNLSDVIEKSVFLPENQQDLHAADPPPKQPAALPFPSICRPKCSDSNQPIISIKDVMLPRSKIFEKYPPFVKSFNPDGHTCPPASPISQPLNPFYNHHEKSSKQRKIRDKKKTKTKTKARNSKKNKSNGDFFPFSTSSFDSNTYRGWWSSSDDETDTLFSSKSHSSLSSGPRLRGRSRPNGSSSSRRRESSDVGLLPLQGKVKDSFAVVKKSSDPYNDFRTSMVEMIFEKQIFSAKDLEQLLQCFLSLNSTHHHRVIIEVFTEIWEALFSNWGS